MPRIVLRRDALRRRRPLEPRRKYLPDIDIDPRTRHIPPDSPIYLVHFVHMILLVRAPTRTEIGQGEMLR